MSFLTSCVLVISSVFGVPNTPMSFDPCPPLAVRFDLDCQFWSTNKYRDDMYARCYWPHFWKPLVYDGMVYRARDI